MRHKRSYQGTRRFNISIHAPYKRVRRYYDSHANRYHTYFNPRTLQESATKLFGQDTMALLFQSTHPTRECDLWSALMQTTYHSISIHAPYKRVRRATSSTTWLRSQFQSTHPTRECDGLHHQLPDFDHNFNPRTLQESATDRFNLFEPLLKISIHAPYKRVRLASNFSRLISSKYFNPRTLQESATSFPNIFSVLSLTFQSTHPTRECDKEVSENVNWPIYYFNPRTLQESAT